LMEKFRQRLAHVFVYPVTSTSFRASQSKPTE
jgi:hypothetical protein